MSAQKTEGIVTVEQIEPRILLIRGERVILDADLAVLYGVTTKRLNEQVKRNRGRFPEDFVFQLSAGEAEAMRSLFAAEPGPMRSQFATASKRNVRYRPNAFTEHGAIMAASVLNTPRAIEVSVYVVRAFVRLRQVLAGHRELARKLEELEQKVASHDEAIRALVAAIRQLAEPRPASNAGKSVSTPDMRLSSRRIAGGKQVGHIGSLKVEKRFGGRSPPQELRQAGFALHSGSASGRYRRGVCFSLWQVACLCTLSVEGGEIVVSLRMRRPEDVKPRAWETAVTWASIAYGNVCIPDAVSIADMKSLVFDLEAKTKNDLDLSTCDWIWRRLKAVVPGGSNYYAKFWPEYRRDLAYAQANDESLPILQGFTEQRYLDLRGTSVTDGGLISLKKAKELESLSLSELITDAGMTHLNGLRNLRWLSLMGTKVTDTGLEQLKDLPRLEKLYVAGSGVTQEGEMRFRQRLPRCEIVR